MKRGGWTWAASALAAVVLAGCSMLQPVMVKFSQDENGKPEAPQVIYPTGQSGGEPQVLSVGATASGSTPQTQTVAIPVVKYALPNRPSGQGATTPALGPKEIVASANVKLLETPEKDSYRGGAVVYNWVPDQVYEIFVAPLHLTDIALEPGETVVSPVAAGDTSDFMVGTAYSISRGLRVEHVDVKAVYPGKQTTLGVYTDRRTYTFAVYSYNDVYMPLVSFDYPLEQVAAQVRAQADAARKLLMYGDITNLDFGYEIVPHGVTPPPWTPSKVFTDGERTYIDFPSAGRLAYAPVLFTVDAKGQLSLVNYRVVGDYYVVDQVLEHAELVLGVQNGDMVSILREH